MNVPTGPPDGGPDATEVVPPSVDPWANVARVGLGPGGSLSVVEGATFLISDLRGDVIPGGAHGLFHRDTRFLSRLELTVDGRRPEILAARTVDPYSARFVLRLPWDGPGESPLVATRNRFVQNGLHEDVEIANHGLDPVELAVEVGIDADFADLFEVKARGDAPKPGVTRRRAREEGLLAFEYVLAHMGADLLPQGIVMLHTAERTIAPLTECICVHPTLSEGVKAAVTSLKPVESVPTATGDLEPTE